MDADLQGRLEAIFLEEAEEHLRALASGLIEWEREGSPGARRHAEPLYRAAHSLKGAARAVSYREMESVCQVLEGALAGLKEQRAGLTPRIFDILNQARGQLEAMVARRAARQEPLEADAGLLQRLRSLEKQEAEPQQPPSGGPPQPSPPGPGIAPPREKPQTRSAPEAQEETVRVPMRKLERLLDLSEQLLSLKLSSIRLAEALKEVQSGLAEKGLGPQGPANLDGALRGISDLARHHRDEVRSILDRVAEDARDLLLLPLSGLLEVFPKLARDMATESGKQVVTRIAGGDTELERPALGGLRDVLVHLVRNAVDHGIEPPEEREARGKPRQGRLSIQARAIASNRILIQVEDDGRGLDVAALKAAAVAAGALTLQEAETLREEDLPKLAFRSGLSTRAAVTALSGRGLGLAIVKEKVEALGGTVSLESAPGHGARFTLEIPTKHAGFRGILVEVQGRSYVIPSHQVLQAVALKEEDKKGPGGPVLRHREEWIPLVRLADVLGVPTGARGPRESAALVVEHGGGRRAYGVDRVVNEHELLIQPLEPAWRKLELVSGLTLLPSGAWVVVMDLVRAGQDPGRMPDPSEADPARAAPSRKRILLAEDSITSRTLLKSIIESAGMTVETAVDGEAAWQRLQETRYDAVVSDIEMPRMNGFELLGHIRRREDLDAMPVLLVTSLNSPADRQRAAEGGANGFIAKGEFEPARLLALLGGLP